MSETQTKEKKKYESYASYCRKGYRAEKPSTFQRKTEFSGKIPEKNNQFESLSF